MKHDNNRIGRHLSLCGAFAGLLMLSAPASADDVASLKERLELCAGCHNADGNTIIPDHPKLAGLDAKYIARQLRDFKSGERPSPVMSGIIPMIDEAQFEELAAFFSEQKRTSGVATDPKLAAQGKAIYDEGVNGSAVPACAGCHNEDGSGSAKYPRLTGQNPGYVTQQLLNFKNGVRSNDPKGVMRTVAKRLTEQEISAVAEYVTTLKEETEE